MSNQQCESGIEACNECGTDAQGLPARERADYILPRLGHTPHRLAHHAANRLVLLGGRTGAFSPTANDVPLPGNASSA